MKDRITDLRRAIVHWYVESFAGLVPASRLATGAFWSVLAGVSSQLLAFFASVWVARTLGGEQFGEFAMIRNTAMMFGILAAFGTGLTATKHVAEYRKVAPKRAGRIVALATGVAVCSGVAMAVLLWVLASTLARYVLHAPHLTGVLRISSLLLILNTVSFAQTGALAGFEAFKEMAKVGVIAGAVSFSALVVATSVAGLQGAIWGAVIGLGTHCVLYQLALLRETANHGSPVSYTSCLREWRTLWSFNLPIALSNLVTAPALWAVQTLLVNQPGGYVQMGIFNIADQWRRAILFIPERLGLITLPILSSVLAEGRLRRFRRTLGASVALNVCAALVLVIPIILFARWIVRAYGSDFHSGFPTLSLLAVSAVFVSIGAIGERALVSLGRVWLRFAAHLLCSAVLLGCGYVLVADGGGATQLAIAVLISCAFFAVVVIAALLRSLGSDVHTQNRRFSPHADES